MATWKYDLAGVDLDIWIDLGKDKPGMMLQCREREGHSSIWREYLVDGKQVKVPIKIDSLPLGKYRLV